LPYLCYKDNRLSHAEADCICPADRVTIIHHLQAQEPTVGNGVAVAAAGCCDRILLQSDETKNKEIDCGGFGTSHYGNSSVFSFSVQWV